MLDSQIYVINCRVGVSADTPISSKNSDLAVLNHKNAISTDSKIEPIGSIHHLSLLPNTEVMTPNLLESLAAHSHLGILK